MDLDFFKRLMEHIKKTEQNKKSKNKEFAKLAKAQRRVQRKVRGQFFNVKSFHLFMISSFLDEFSCTFTLFSDAAAKRKEMDSSSDSDSDVVAGEKENEDLSNDGGSDTTPKKHRGRGTNTPDRRIKRTNGEGMRGTIKKYIYIYILQCPDELEITAHA